MEQPQYGFDDEGPRFCGCHKRDGMSARWDSSIWRFTKGKLRTLNECIATSHNLLHEAASALLQGASALCLPFRYGTINMLLVH